MFVHPSTYFFDRWYILIYIYIHKYINAYIAQNTFKPESLTVTSLDSHSNVNDGIIKENIQMGESLLNETAGRGREMDAHNHTMPFLAWSELKVFKIKREKHMIIKKLVSKICEITEFLYKK